MAEQCRALREHFDILIKAKLATGDGRVLPADELHAASSAGSVGVLQVKAAHRALAETSEAHREAAVETKTTYGQGSLQLHNIQYECSHYGKEIRSCRSFKSAYTDEQIGLLPLKEFLQTEAAAKLSDEQRADEHQLMLARLSHELVERQRLVKQQEALRERKHALADGLQQRRKVLAGLATQLSGLAAAAAPISASLLEGGGARGGGLPPLRLAQLQPTAELLPLPLYVVFSQVLAASEAFGLPVSAEVEGNFDDAQRYAAGDAILTPGGAQGGGGRSASSSKRQRVASAASLMSDVRGDNNSGDLYQAHPLSVRVLLPPAPDGGDAPAPGPPASIPPPPATAASRPSVLFRYLPSLKLVTAEGVGGAPDLGSLYPGDHGRDTPSGANRLLLHGAEFRFSQERRDRPYRWAQHIAGMDFLPEVPRAGGPTTSDGSAAVEHGLSDCRRQQRMAHVLQRLISCKDATAALKSQLDKLTKLELPLRPASFKPLTTLMRWEQINATPAIAPRSQSRSNPKQSSARPASIPIPPGLGGNISSISPVPAQRQAEAAAAMSDGEEEGELPVHHVAEQQQQQQHEETGNGTMVVLDYTHSCNAAAAGMVQQGGAQEVARRPVHRDAPPSAAAPVAEPYVPRGFAQYRVLFRREGVEIEATVALSAEYPSFAPEWRLLAAWDASLPARPGGSRPAAARLTEPGVGDQLRALEQEANVGVVERVPQAMALHLLSYQVVALLRGIDAAAEHWVVAQTLPGRGSAVPESSRPKLRGPGGHAALPDTLL